MSLILLFTYPALSEHFPLALFPMLGRLLTVWNRHRKEQGLALRDTAQRFENDNEMTFLVNVWTEFLGGKATRLVKWTVDGELEDKEAAIEWIETAWEKDHLKCNWNSDFTQGSIPPLKYLDKDLKALADSAPKVKNPKPDLTYGLLEAAFEADAQRVNDENGAGLVTNGVHPFFVVEAKSAERPIDEAQNQCARGGAAMVRLKRKFDGLAEGTYTDEKAQHEGDKDSPNNQKFHIDRYRTDDQSFAFSLAIVPRYAMVFVHWAEEAYSIEGVLVTINWHMNWVTDYNLVSPAAWIGLHHDIDNILDWGVLTRKKELDDLCKKILEREQKEGSNKKQKT